MGKNLQAILVLSSLLILDTTSVDILQVDVDRHRLVDAAGRERYFHGVNVVVKGPPWIPVVDSFDPDWSFSIKDMETLQQLGLNGIRYLRTVQCMKSPLQICLNGLLLYVRIEAYVRQDRTGTSYAFLRFRNLGWQ